MSKYTITIEPAQNGSARLTIESIGTSREISTLLSLPQTSLTDTEFLVVDIIEHIYQIVGKIPTPVNFKG